MLNLVPVTEWYLVLLTSSGKSSYPRRSVEKKYSKAVGGKIQVEKRKLTKLIPLTQKLFSNSSVMLFRNTLYVIISLKHRRNSFFSGIHFSTK